MRSLTSPVLKWPEPKKIIQALKHWVEKLVKTRSDIVRIGYFGSYARGNWGVGSDLDLIIIVSHADIPFEMRPSQFDTLELLVPVDILIYTLEEWQMNHTKKFFQTLENEAVWVYRRTL
ncbi:MAG: nucleotidyltransferase domain-containing protein [Desulfobaccales bacterium]